MTGDSINNNWLQVVSAIRPSSTAYKADWFCYVLYTLTRISWPGVATSVYNIVKITKLMGMWHQVSSGLIPRQTDWLPFMNQTDWSANQFATLLISLCIKLSGRRVCGVNIDVVSVWITAQKVWWHRRTGGAAGVSREPESLESQDPFTDLGNGIYNETSQANVPGLLVQTPTPLPLWSPDELWRQPTAPPCRVLHVSDTCLESLLVSSQWLELDLSSAELASVGQHSQRKSLQLQRSQPYHRSGGDNGVKVTQGQGPKQSLTSNRLHDYQLLVNQNWA